MTEPSSDESFESAINQFQAMSVEEKEHLSLEKNITSYLKSLGIKTKTDPYDKKYIFKEQQINKCNSFYSEQMLRESDSQQDRTEFDLNSSTNSNPAKFTELSHMQRVLGKKQMSISVESRPPNESLKKTLKSSHFSKFKKSIQL